MKYLKYFENTKLYQWIPSGYKFDSLKPIEPSYEVINLLNQYISKYFEGKLQKFRIGTGWELYSVFYTKKSRIAIDIVEYEDEWFIVNIQRQMAPNFLLDLHSFKCDTVEGVVQLLDHIKNDTLQ